MFYVSVIVVSPSCLFLYVSQFYKSFNRAIYVSNSTPTLFSGLCGVFDGNSTNDLLGANNVLYAVANSQDEPDAFSNSYRYSNNFL